MDETERLNALEVALNNEMKEREFYMKNAGRTSNPLGKAMFRQIADEELEHYERLQQLHGKWVKHDKWPETVPLKVKETNIGETLAAVLKGIDRSAKADADDLAAVRTAVDFEERGFQFYAKLGEASSDPREKAFFELLSAIEHEHYLSLRNAEEYFSDPTGWLLRVEHHTLDGA